MKTTYLKTEHTYFDVVIKITDKKVLECNKDDILTNDISDESHEEAVAYYFRNNEKCRIITKEEFEEVFIKTVDKINEISKL